MIVGIQYFSRLIIAAEVVLLQDCFGKLWGILIVLRRGGPNLGAGCVDQEIGRWLALSGGWVIVELLSDKKDGGCVFVPYE